MNTFAGNIFKQNSAVGSTGGFASMVHRTMINVGMHQIQENSEGLVPIVAIDDVPYNGVDLLWLDIEEYEIHALKGAVQTIRNNNPIVMCENATPAIDKFMLDQFGYIKVGVSHMDGIYYLDK
jgi:hypothetical protein